jgi:hypothetical protein
MKAAVLVHYLVSASAREPWAGSQHIVYGLSQPLDLPFTLTFDAGEECGI